MASFVQLNENNVVINGVAVNNNAIDDLPFPESEPVGVKFLKDLYGENTVWAQTSYNANFRYNYAGLDFTYDPVADAFIPPKPFPSWLLNTEKYLWEPPIPYPNDGKGYNWDETTQSWVEANFP